MTKVYLECCFFLYQEKLVLWHQFSEKKAQIQTSVRVRHALLALLVSSLGFIANVLFSHKYGADATGGNAVGTAAYHHPENFDLLNLGLNTSVNKRMYTQGYF